MKKARNNKVMLAEDDVTMQTVLQTLLEIEGFTVALAPVKENQTKLIGAVRAERPDVLLLDYRLGNISGLDILRLLRENTDTAQTRVIMISGMDMQDYRLTAGADDFILKPFMPEELILKLRE